METLKGKDHQEGAGLLTRSITRRQAIKAGGIAVVGLAFSKPLSETVMPKPAFANYTPNGTNSRGCTPGYWKNHPNAWSPSGFSTTDTVGSLFTVPTPSVIDSLASDTLLQALNYGGGPGVLGGAIILLRAAVAAAINAAHPEVDYPRTLAQVINQVNAALASLNRNTMLALAGDENTPGTLDYENNLDCLLN